MQVSPWNEGPDSLIEVLFLLTLDAWYIHATDFCSPTPEDVVENIGNEVFDSISDLDFLNYYIINVRILSSLESLSVS